MKNAIVGGLVGLLFMGGGFYCGLKLKPLPAPVSAPPISIAVAPSKDVFVPPPGTPITLDTLRKTSESMMKLNEALQAREQAVAERERKVQESEDELAAEREALNRSHERFKELYSEFQSRLQLVEANQVDQVQKQADLYASMGTTQSIDLVRAMDDASMIRIFSVMDTKPLGKLIAEWKTKYPEDTPRLLHNLDGMAQVMPKEKIALSDVEPSTPVGPRHPAPDAPASTPPDATPAPPAAPDPSASPPSSSGAVPSDTTAPSASPAPSPADAAPVPSLTPPPDSTAAPVSTATSN
jgi:hypothetical protein